MAPHHGKSKSICKNSKLERIIPGGHQLDKPKLSNEGSFNCVSRTLVTTSLIPLSAGTEIVGIGGSRVSSITILSPGSCVDSATPEFCVRAAVLEALSLTLALVLDNLYKFLKFEFSVRLGFFRALVVLTAYISQLR